MAIHRPNRVVCTMLFGALLLLGIREAEAQIRPQFGISIPMRDKVNLVADLWLPDTVGRHPTILIRTPYVRTAQFKRYKLIEYLKRGYAIVLQDTRGRGDSEGQFDFYFPEAKDGYDTIEWIAKQSWSDGKVGMDSGSYLGTVQWLAARERPPHLACIAPTAPSGRLFDEIPYQGGAFRMEWALEWLNSVAGRTAQDDFSEVVKWPEILKHRPLLTMDDAFGRRIPLYREILNHPTMDSYWKRIHFTAADFAKMNLPVLHVTGWYDGDQLGALSYWDGMEASGPVKDNRFLIIGPWTHGMTYLGGDKKLGAFEFSPEAVIDIQGERLKFFDYCLKGTSPKYEAPRVRVYVTGANKWRESNRYPLPETKLTKLYLRSGGKANTLDGDGTLSWDAPTTETPDQYTYDPKDPAPSKSPATDHRVVERRQDVLVYTTPALTDAVEVVGRIWVELFAASDALDTDFTAKVIDVYPDGRAIKLGPVDVGVKRARYRNGYDKTELLTPNKTEKYAIELFDVGHAFLPGHKIRVEISSSAFPYISPNQNTGNPVATDIEWKVARQTIFHDGQHASHVLLPIIPAGH